MGITSAIGAGLSVVGGVMGLSQQQKQANAQKKMLDAQDAQQRLQAQLQLFALKNQRVIDNLQDTLSDAANKQAYLQTDAGLRLQQQMNTLATQNAIFGSQVEALQGNIGETQSQMQAEGQRSAQKEGALAAETQAIGGVGQESSALLSSLLESIGTDNKSRAALSTIMDVAASSGGMNEALQLFLDSDAFAAERNANAAARQDEVGATKTKSARAIKGSTDQLADVAADLGISNAALQNMGTQFQSRMGQLDARTAQTVADNTFASQGLANKQNYDTGIMANTIQRSSRYLQSQASEEALAAGQALSADTIAAQKSSIQSPGLFDYLAVGLQGYNTFNQMSYKPPALRVNR